MYKKYFKGMREDVKEILEMLERQLKDKKINPKDKKKIDELLKKYK